jgi:hypothetical protein
VTGERFALDILTPRQARCGFFATRRQDPVVAPELAVASELRVDRVKPPRWGPNGVFRMGVAGWRLAHTKRIVIGRATVVAVLEDWHLICSVVVAAGSMIMIGITLYNNLQQ